MDQPSKTATFEADENDDVVTSSGLFITPDGSKLINCDNHGKAFNILNAIRVFEMSTPWDISTIDESVDELTDWSYDCQNETLDPSDITFNSSAVGLYQAGQVMFICGKDEDIIFVYYCSTPYRPSTAVRLEAWDLDMTTTTCSHPTHLEFCKDGWELHVSCLNDLYIRVFRLTEPYNPSTAVEMPLKQFDASGEFTFGAAAVRAMAYRYDGQRMYLAGVNNSDSKRDVVEYELEVAFDPSTASFLNLYDTNVNSVGDIVFNEAAENLIVSQLTGGLITTMSTNN